MANSTEYAGLSDVQLAILSSVSHDDKASVMDGDPHFIIDIKTKTITNQSGKKEFVQFEHNSERLTFECDRYIEGHDVLLCNSVKIHYIAVDVPGIYEIEDVSAKEDDETKVIFSWLISSNVTQKVGKIRFAINFRCVQDTGEVTYSWSTKINEELSCTNGICNSETVVQENVDVLEQWKQEIFQITGVSDEQVQTAVNSYLETHPIEESDPTVPDWAKSPTKPKYTASEVGALPDSIKSLPNPSMLTFTGAVECSYNGSETVTVHIPSGGDEGDSVGGFPMPLIQEVMISEEVTQVEFTELDLDEFALEFIDVISGGDASEYVRINGFATIQNTIYALIPSEKGNNLIYGARITNNMYQLHYFNGNGYIRLAPLKLTTSINSVMIHGQKITSGTIRLYGR